MDYCINAICKMTSEKKNEWAKHKSDDETTIKENNAIETNDYTNCNAFTKLKPDEWKNVEEREIDTLL